ncbi:diaminohydroxyphosphoribosylaminopyrimidine deaminase / 5-amino-6-(5-phosphoribosylamino)uracil reductase [Devosia sp. YR412]|uniref:bifunctional diaminohydroxyphosphoribosylaminopyrimidine deaminase/5-amino-6-(5-phosphoribosylamino)uracil reductase RibD n=1 Tax=Devosia sp. YR412 TaxID=1881030 RepID=UPI0008BA7DF6|nr:bifunctional diaminohydroxyphosphoribosylaminopyrimidine deaminase/5-amino-6-(5-phosphoribosylamino)uracil reductase RibD [Devosia sp. YR412]SEQ63190.1 diaminohydroxyphosphoribosylaminopyrimidine deaminase / 5-amino-6-(5-phosphoribosylamino)uracil reductase [Devosia sp. YR412]
MSELTPEDRRWLDAAARYAAPFTGTTADNPAVAALLVEPISQTLVSRAVTAKGGRPHAESQVIETAGFEAAGCTLYVTLEPCHHWDRTPPCVDAIIRAGIMRVVIGAADPQHVGSMALLESAGVETILADHAPSLALHAGHLLRHAKGRPFVNTVLAVSADGKLDRSGEAQASILGAGARDWIGMQRARSDAILVGAATARTDPDLTVKLPGLATRTPLRVVLSGATGVDRRMNLIGGFSGHRTAIIAETGVAVDAPVSVETMRVNGLSGRPDLKAALAALSGKGIQNVLVEPGQRLLAAMLDADLVDAITIITAPSRLGDEGLVASPDGPLTDLLAAAGLVEIDQQRLGDDVLVRYGRPAKPV